MRALTIRDPEGVGNLFKMRQWGSLEGPTMLGKEPLPHEDQGVLWDFRGWGRVLPKAAHGGNGQRLHMRSKGVEGRRAFQDGMFLRWMERVKAGVRNSFQDCDRKR